MLLGPHKMKMIPYFSVLDTLLNLELGTIAHVLELKEMSHNIKNIRWNIVFKQILLYVLYLLIEGVNLNCRMIVNLQKKYIYLIRINKTLKYLNENTYPGDNQTQSKHIIPTKK